MSQTQAAAQANMSRTQWVRYETTDRMPQVKELLRINSVLRSGTDWLLGLASNLPPVPLPDFMRRLEDALADTSFLTVWRQVADLWKVKRDQGLAVGWDRLVRYVDDMHKLYGPPTKAKDSQAPATEEVP